MIGCTRQWLEGPGTSKHRWAACLRSDVHGTPGIQHTEHEVCSAQAQESGAHAQMVDDALYALDGLVPGVGEQALADRAACLASLAASRRGLLALK